MRVGNIGVADLGESRNGWRLAGGTHAGQRGRDAARKQYVDLIEASIIAPTKVGRIVLENAMSIATVLLTETTMTELPESKKGSGAELEIAM